MGKKRKSLPPMIRQDMKVAAQKLVERRIVEIMRKMHQEAVVSVVAVYGTVLCWVLHKRLGWGKVRLRRLLAEVTADFEAVDQGYLSIEDIEQALFDETGLNMRELNDQRIANDLAADTPGGDIESPHRAPGWGDKDWRMTQ